MNVLIFHFYFYSVNMSRLLRFSDSFPCYNNWNPVEYFNCFNYDDVEAIDPYDLYLFSSVIRIDDQYSKYILLGAYYDSYTNKEHRAKRRLYYCPHKVEKYIDKIYGEAPGYKQVLEIKYGLEVKTGEWKEDERGIVEAEIDCIKRYQEEDYKRIFRDGDKRSNKSYRERITLEDGKEYTFNLIHKYYYKGCERYYVLTSEDKIIFLPTRVNRHIEQVFNLDATRVDYSVRTCGVVKVNGKNKYKVEGKEIEYLNIMIKATQ